MNNNKKLRLNLKYEKLKANLTTDDQAQEAEVAELVGQITEIEVADHPHKTIQYSTRNKRKLIIRDGFLNVIKQNMENR